MKYFYATFRFNAAQEQSGASPQVPHKTSNLKLHTFGSTLMENTTCYPLLTSFTPEQYWYHQQYY